jgi:hypothetical protein
VNLLEHHRPERQGPQRPIALLGHGRQAVRPDIESIAPWALSYFLLSLAKAHSPAPAVLVDELDACCLKRSTYCLIICDCHVCMNVGELSPPYCAQAYGRRPRKIFGAPSQHCPGGSDLEACHPPSRNDGLCVIVIFRATRQCQVQEAADCL